MRGLAISLVIATGTCRDACATAERTEATSASVADVMPPVPTAVARPPRPGHAQLPSSRATPDGIAQREWRDIHWLAPTVLEVARYEREHALMLRWLEDQIPADVATCKGVLAGARRLLAVEVPRADSAEAQIVIGRLDRSAVEACLRDAGTGLSVTPDGVFTVLDFSGLATSYIGWAELGDEVVAIYDDDRELIRSWLDGQPDALQANQTMLELLRRVDVTRPIVLVSARPSFETQLGVSTRGMYYGMDGPFVRSPSAKVEASGAVVLVDTAGGEAALAKARELASKVEARTEIDAEIGIDAAGALAFRITYTVEELGRAAMDATLVHELGLDVDVEGMRALAP